MFKLAIGSANFNQRYGVDNISLKNTKNIKNIFKEIGKNKIKFFDTAIDYKLEKNLIDSINLKNLKVTTKIRLPNINKKKFTLNIKKKIQYELKKFQIKKFDTILLHNINDLKSSKYRSKLINELSELKKKKLTSKIGVSIYEPNDLKIVFKIFNPDVIQIPLNIFDQRFLKNNLLKKIKKKKILIQVRSIFLQGLLLKNQKEINKIKYKKKLKQKLINFSDWCFSSKLTQLNACIQFIKNIKHIDFIILGINNSTQLKEIIKTFKKKNKIKNFKELLIDDKSLIDPRKW